MINIYGLSRPYDFTKALPFLVSLCLFFFVFASGALLAIIGKLSVGTDRWYFFLYVALTLLLSAGISFLPRLAWCLVTLAFLELAVGAGTHLLATANIGRSLFPDNGKRNQRFVYHPLLQGIPAPNFEETRNGRTVQHNQYGLRGAPIPSAKDADAIVIAALGGSTTYDLALSEGSTWPEALQKNLGKRYLVLNFGVPGYTTAEHVIQTAFYLNKTGFSPDCAIYYIGWNDIRNSHLPNPDPGYADFHLLSQAWNLRVRREGRAVRVSSLLAIFSRQVRLYFDTVPLAPEYEPRSTSAEVDRRLEDIYRRNIRSIVAMNEAHKVRTIFVGQVLNKTRLTEDKLSGWLPLVKDKDVWAIQSVFNDALLDESTKMGRPAIILDANDFDDSDFVDHGHFSERGAVKFASKIAQQVSAVCER